MSQQSSKSEKAADKPKSSSEKEKDKEKKKSSKDENEKKKPSKEEKENEKKPVKEDKKKDEKKKDEKKKDAKREDAKERPHCISSIHVNLPVKKVEVHPLVLLSVVDHFGRATRSGRTGRAVGVLLGSLKRDRTLDVANCFAVPFDEEGKDTFFLDRDYLESMSNMFRKVAARERIVGWYHTGPRLRPNDIAVNEQLKAFTPNPVLVIVAAAEQRERGLPTEAYIEVQEVHDDGTPPVKSFEHVPSSIAAEASEDIGVEQLLRGIKSQTAGTLSQRVTDQLFGVRGLETQLRGVEKYLRDVAAGALPVNHTVIFYIQDAINLLPDARNLDLIEAHTVAANDEAMCVFLGSLVRSVIALHNLLDNKIALQTCDDGDGTELNGKKKKKKQKDRSHLKTSKTVSSVSK